MQIYNETQAFRKGTLEYFSDPDVVMFTKTFENEKYLVIVNVRNIAKEVLLDESLQNTSWVDKLHESNVALGNKLSLSPYTYMILKK
jgi:hypothetical protein